MGGIVFDLALTPVCAVLAGIVVWLNSRRHRLADGELIRLFLLVLAICIAVGVAIGRTDFAKSRLDARFKADKALMAQPVMLAMQRLAPSDAERVRATMAASRPPDRQAIEPLTRARPMIAALVRQRLGFADQQAKIAWGRVAVDALRELQAHSAMSCYRAMAERQATEPDEVAWSADNMKAFEQAAIAVYESSDRSMRRQTSATNEPSDHNGAVREYAVIRGQLAERFGEAVAGATGKRPYPLPPALPAETMCTAAIAQLEAMLTRPQAIAGTLIDNVLR